MRAPAGTRSASPCDEVPERARSHLGHRALPSDESVDGSVDGRERRTVADRGRVVRVEGGERVVEGVGDAQHLARQLDHDGAVAIDGVGRVDVRERRCGVHRRQRLLRPHHAEDVIADLDRADGAQIGGEVLDPWRRLAAELTDHQAAGAPLRDPPGFHAVRGDVHEREGHSPGAQCGDERRLVVAVLAREDEPVVAQTRRHPFRGFGRVLGADGQDDAPERQIAGLGRRHRDDSVSTRLDAVHADARDAAGADRGDVVDVGVDDRDVVALGGEPVGDRPTDGSGTDDRVAGVCRHESDVSCAG